MSDFSYGDLEGSGGPSSPSPFLKEFIDAGRDALCQYYSEGPGQAAGSALSVVGLGAIDQLYRRVCRPSQPQPPLPQLPFQGGQCPISYLVTTQSFLNGGPFSTLTRQFTGPIGREVVFLDSPPRTGFFVRHAGGRAGIIEAGNDSSPNGIITNVVPVNPGQPDSCGNPPPQLPLSPTLVEPPRTRPPVLLPPGPGLPRIPIPPIVIPPFRLPPIPIPFPPIPGIPWALPPIKPELNVQVGPFNFTFDFGGVSINFTTNVNFNAPGSQPTPPDGGARPLPPGQSFPDDCCSDIRAIAERQKKQPAIGDYSLALGAPQPLAEGGRVTLPFGVCRVRIVDVVQTNKQKRQKGFGGTDVLWAGWFWYDAGDGEVAERLPIDAESKTFWCDPDPVFPGMAPLAFQYTLYPGVTANYCVDRLVKV